MFHLFLFFLGLSILGVVVLFFVSLGLVRRYLAVCKEEQLARLSDYQSRLSQAVDALLTWANELDQEQRYFVLDPEMKLPSRLGRTCSQLVVLGETLKSIDEQLKIKDVQKVRGNLFRTVNLALTLVHELKDMQMAIPVNSGKSFPDG